MELAGALKGSCCIGLRSGRTSQERSLCEVDWFYWTAPIVNL